jgi:hypothetical protein
MKKGLSRQYVVAAVAVAAAVVGAFLYLAGRPGPITVDYPLADSVFPPEFPPPRLEWRDSSPRARVWTIDVSFGAKATPSLHATSRGEPIEIGPIDERAVGPTNELPKLTPKQAAAHTWRPDPET